jgi:hypothetical protein
VLKSGSTEKRKFRQSGRYPTVGLREATTLKVLQLAAVRRWTDLMLATRLLG